jgi:hypothetical protein
MCRAERCQQCGGLTWSGCGRHVADVMNGVPEQARCSCRPDEPEPGGLLAALFGKRSGRRG